MNSKSEKELTPSIACNHCGNVAPMKVVSRYSQVKEHCDKTQNSPPWEEGNVYELLLCFSCNKVALRKYHYHEWL